MSQHRKIFWRPDKWRKDGKRYAHVHYLVGYSQGYISDYLDMLKVIQEVAPEANEGNVHCGRVHRSDFCFGFTILTFDGYIDELDSKDESWAQYNENMPDGSKERQKHPQPDYYW